MKRPTRRRLERLAASVLFPRLPARRDPGALLGPHAPPPGGFVVFREGRRSLARLRTTRSPLRPILCADLERGPGQVDPELPRLPSALALGAADDVALAEEAGRLTGAFARRLGLDVVLGPVADLLVRPDAPIVGDRSFGARPGRAAQLAAAWARGAVSVGARAVAKHYPGHGAAPVDSHVTLPTLTGSKRSFARREEAPFRRLLGIRGVHCMVGHLCAPALQPDAPRAPAALSVDLLERLRGLAPRRFTLLSDALDMGALAGHDVVEAAVRALSAGIDVLLHPSDPRALHRGLVRAVSTGRLPVRRLEQAARAAARLRALRPPPPPPRSDRVHRFVEQVARRSLVGVRFRPPTTPLRLRLFDQRREGPAPGEALLRALSRRGLLTEDPAAPLAIVVTLRPSAGRGTLLPEGLVEGGVLGPPRASDLLVLFGGPPVPVLERSARALLVSPWADAACAEAVADALSGSLRPRGRPCWRTR